ncbi:iron-containing alcohol dehydrogenase [Thalassobius sp. Cn5-15]|uniref:iron-containing alcohol dehydrogenase n=1 Tax=Thalassobius sp. Cn5-15 TaxID=2917763 RepID=UPI001EF24DED|nr:iron-containing alcohol dehydrogenase [Thalassobius sp. Cn5-15]MCG7495088.1 iron-containing alcohol dehydrogenase [Thalassobius sp. Cn5-15]
MAAAFHINTPTAVQFGAGVVTMLHSVLPDPAGTVLLVRGSSEAQAAPVIADLAAQGIPLQQIAVTAEPSVASVNAAFAAVSDTRFGAIIACGGGSVLDTAKALRFCLEWGRALPDNIAMVDPAALQRDPALALIAIPTTAGTGAEVTSNAVLGVWRAGGAAKLSLRGRGLFPSVALVDPDLLATTPKSVALGSGLDAVTQTIEAYTSSYATPFTAALSEPNLRLGARALRRIIEGPDPEAWQHIAWVSLSSGLALANGGLGAAHGLAAVLGARLKAPHGLLCGRLLAPVLIQNRSKVQIGSDVFTRIENSIEALAEVFPKTGGRNELSGFETWLRLHRVPRLCDFGLTPADFAAVAESAVYASSSTKNAVPLEIPDFIHILEAAH